MDDNSSSKVYPFFTTRRLKKTQTGLKIDASDKSKNFTDDLCTFTSETSLHGIRFVGNRSIWFTRRCIWTIIVTSALGFLVYLLKHSVIYYQSRPVGTAISFARNNEIPFPAVTFCNYNQIRKSKVSDKVKAIIQANYQEEPLNYSEVNNWNMTEIFLEASHPIKELLVDCKWMSVAHCTHENFTTHIYDFGVCYTFKSSVNVTNAGVTSSLFFHIDINNTENTGDVNGISGIKMMIHPSDERPLVASYGFSVSPGFHTEITLKGLQVMNLPDPYSSECREKELRYSDVYTKELCIEECRFDYVIVRCRCKLATMMGDVPECTVEEAFKCAFKAYHQFVSDTNVTCKCPVACSQTKYQPRISTTLWPDPSMLEYIQDQYGYTKEYVRENLLQVRISYEDLDMEVTELVPLYTIVQLLSEIGGNMGLLCGMSLVTLVEFLDFAIVAFIERILKKKAF